jgi:hypothetical protein
MLKFLVALSLFFAVASVANAAKKPVFTLVDGKKYEVCRKVTEILNTPENRDTFNLYGDNDVFVIPKRYKDFGVLQGEDIPLTDWEKYIGEPVDPNPYVRKVLKQNLVQFRQEWEQGKLEYVRKAQVNIDNFTEKETIIFFKTKADNYPQYVISKDASEGVREALENHLGGFVFSYQGRWFQTGYGDGERGIGITENKGFYGDGRPSSGISVMWQYVCVIKGPPRLKKLSY